MKPDPLVSIIINCHNGEKFLRDAVNSIICQSYNNWEIIFWDNYSTDNSKDIINSFNDKRIKYFYSNKFTNLYLARNNAIAKSEGKYVCFLDSDDLWTKDKLVKQVNFLKNNNEFQIVYSNYYTLNKKQICKIQFKKNSLPYGNITKQLLKKYSIGILTLCIEKEFFKKYIFNNNYNVIGDFDYMIMLSLKKKIGCIQEPLAYYRIHDDNYSKKKISVYIKELKNWIKLNEKFFKNKGFNLNYQKFLLFKLRLKKFLQFFNFC